jgi:hypothetical protein
MHKHIIPTAFLALVFAGCEFLGLASDEPTTIEFELTIDKTVVASGDRLVATFVARNNTFKSVRLLTGCDDVAPIGVYKDGEKVDFYNGSSRCSSSNGYHEISPDRIFLKGWFIYAYKRTEIPGQLPDTTHVAPGDYTLRVVAHVNDKNDKTLKVEHLEVDFKVE